MAKKAKVKIIFDVESILDKDREEFLHDVIFAIEYLMGKLSKNRQINCIYKLDIDKNNSDVFLINSGK